MRRVSFCGWIPCVSSRLSFSVAGRFTRDTLRNYYRDDNRLGLYCGQKRNLSDAKLTRSTSWVAPVLESFSSGKEKLYFEFFAHSKKGQSGTFKKLRGTILVSVEKPSFPYGFQERNKIFSVDCTLFRNGFCYFSSPQIGSNTKWNEGSTEANVKEYMTAQTYMFLRDLLHRHKHHDGSTDTIIDIYKPTQQPHWKLRLKFDLMRYVIKYTSGRTPKSYTNSMGTLAYVSAFADLFPERLKKSGFSEFNISAIKDSLESERERAKNTTSSRLWFAGTGLTILLAATRMALGKTPTTLDYSLAFFIIVTAWIVALYWTGILTFSRTPWLVWMNEPLVGLPKRILGLGIIFFSLILLVFSLTLVS